MNKEADYRKTEIYEGLAPVYDELMRDIDYEYWADYIDDLIQSYHPYAEKLLELACGTGSFALSMAEYNIYEITATDLSPEMIRVAQTKDHENSVTWKVLDVRDMDIDGRYDVVIMLFDSINYLMNDDEVVNLFNNVRKILAPKGIFIFDFTTPINSIEAEPLLNEEYTTGSGWHYVRKSHFDPDKGLHYNDFLITPPPSSSVNEEIHETHCQRIFTLHQMISLVAKSYCKILASYEGFDFIEATEKSDRITMILQ